jgi:hypothetical protein
MKNNFFKIARHILKIAVDRSLRPEQVADIAGRETGGDINW